MKQWNIGDRSHPLVKSFPPMPSFSFIRVCPPFLKGDTDRGQEERRPVGQEESDMSSEQDSRADEEERREGRKRTKKEAKRDRSPIFPFLPP